MNIQEAKEQIRETVSIYLKKDRYGNYRIPSERQRPVFLLGAPGIGKTAIMVQIAREMGLPLVSYAMTHHTRQSALGLPKIVSRSYMGETFDISEYTMSEIIAAVYDSMEKSGRKEGILFLDEINCVSETLAPSMLQFLQYKTFGSHKVPEGWVVVTAGNPPEYNRAVHDFDIVTLDRLRIMEVAPDYETWQRYAVSRGFHQSILTYLDIRRDDFYHIDKQGGRVQYVTARGWEDLSEAITLYEESGFAVNDDLISQYIRHERIAGEFAAYYALFRKYGTDYGVSEVLAGHRSEASLQRAKEAPLDERISLIGLFVSAIRPDICQVMHTEDGIRQILPALRQLKGDVAAGKTADVIQALAALRDDERKAIADAAALGGLSDADRGKHQYAADFADEQVRKLQVCGDPSPAGQFDMVRQAYDIRLHYMRQLRDETAGRLKNILTFIDEAFGEGSEMLLLVTELTVDPDAARFVAEHSRETFAAYQERFMLGERGMQLRREAAALKAGRAALSEDADETGEL